MTVRDVVTMIKRGEPAALFSGDRESALQSVSATQLETVLRGLLETPMRRDPVVGRIAMHTYYAYQWLDILRRFFPERHDVMSVVEVAPGTSVMVPRALDVFTGGSGRYVAFNLNRGLSDRLDTLLDCLSVETRVVADDAVHAGRYLASGTVDLFAYNHAVNDMIEHWVARANGFDTIHVDWYARVGDLIEAVEQAHRGNRLEEIAAGPFVQSIRAAITALKPGGRLVFNNYVFAEQVEAGASVELYGSLLSMARSWIKAASLPVQETNLAGYDPDFWLMYRKEEAVV